MACIFYDMPYVIFRHAEEAEISPVLHTGKRVRNCETAMFFCGNNCSNCFNASMAY